MVFLLRGGNLGSEPVRSLGVFSTIHHGPTVWVGDGQRFVNYTLLGNLPTTLDKLSASASLPPIREGDRLALLDAGAYFVPMNNNFAGPRPAIFLIDDKGSGLIRRRETFDDIYHRDII